VDSLVSNKERATDTGPLDESQNVTWVKTDRHKTAQSGLPSLWITKFRNALQ
jgi:hypothetical protein